MTRHFCDPSGRDPAELPAIPQTAAQAEALAWRRFHRALVTFIGEQSPKMGAVDDVDWRDMVNGLSDCLSDATHYAERAEEQALEEVR